MKKRPTLGKLMLLTTAILWGASYVAMVAGNRVGPFLFQTLRSILGACALLPFFRPLDRIGSSKKPVSAVERRSLWRGGILCGILFCVACGLQQIGLLYTTAGKAGFIQAFYIVLVPLFGLVLGQKNAPKVWIAVLMALFGIYLLSAAEGLSFGVGELLMVGSAVFFAVHILVVDWAVQSADGLRLSCIQFFVCSVISAVIAAATEEFSLSAIWDCRIPLLYSGFLSCGLGFTLQILGQVHTNPTLASMLMSLESVFAVFFGWLLLHETMTGRETLGCVIMACAIVLAQLPEKRKRAETDKAVSAQNNPE